MDVRLPDGTIVRGVPDNISKAELVAKLQLNGMAVPADWLAAKPAEQGTSPELQSVVDGMSTPERLLVGVGRGMTELGRGLKQRMGMMSDAEVQDARRLDAPLMKTTAGQVGDVAGKIALALPAAFVPGANTVTGAAAIGGLQGALEPTAGNESVLGNVALGAGLGGGAIMAGRTAKGLYQGGKALIEPFSGAGRERIAGRVIQRFADDPARVAAATGGATATGARPTIAEVTGDSGMARLQDAAMASDPQISNAIGQRLRDNNAARVNALGTLGGSEAQMTAAEAARQAATAPAYAAAFAKNATVDSKFNALLERPSFQKAMDRAARLSGEQGDQQLGIQFGPDGKTITSLSGKALQTLKMAMDDMLQDPRAGIVGAEARAVKQTRDSLVSWMESRIPEFRQARTGYAQASRPINAMQVGNEIARRATSNTSDLAGNPRMQANALLQMLRDEKGLIKRATGRNELNSLDQVLTQQERALLDTVASEVDRAAAVASAGNGPGSATAQRMASQNILSQLIGPTGLPQSWAESAIANTVVGKPLNLIYGGVAEPKIQQALAEAVLDPARARQMLQAAQASGRQLPDNAITRALLFSARSGSTAAAVQPGQR